MIIHLFKVVGKLVKVQLHAFSMKGVATTDQPPFMQHEEDEEEKENVEISKEAPEERKDFTGIINKLKLYLVEYYEPVQDAREAEMHFTTAEIWQQLQRVLPSFTYSQEDVALWMHNAGFTFYDFGEMRLEWLMKKKIAN